MNHSDGLVAWNIADWAKDLNMNRHFSLTKNKLTVKESGLYLVYAQVRAIFAWGNVCSNTFTPKSAKNVLLVSWKKIRVQKVRNFFELIFSRVVRLFRK